MLLTGVLLVVRGAPGAGPGPVLRLHDEPKAAGTRRPGRVVRVPDVSLPIGEAAE